MSFFLYSEFSYTMALVQLYVVLAVGPIFFSLAKIDKTLLEAARDMGATPFQIFREIIAPLSLPGVAIGMIFIFVMLMGEFATAVVVYGGKTSTTGTVILNYYAIANYPFAAVNAFMLMLAMMIGVIIISARGRYPQGALAMARSTPERRRKARVKAGFSVYYAIFLVFVYGPMFAMFTLSFQGRRGGVTFPMRGLSFYWWEKLTGPSVVGDLKSSLVRSLILAVVVMVITATLLDHAGDGFPQEIPRVGRAVLCRDVGIDGAGCSA